MKKSEKRWKLLSSKTILKNKWFSVYSKDYKLPSGKIGKGYYHLLKPDYVLIIAIDDDNKMIVQKNYRRGVDDFIYELPAGWIEKDEKPEQTAERELKEETGYAGKAKVLGQMYAQPGFSSMKAYVVLIGIKRKDKVKQELEHDEYIDYKFIGVDRVYEMADRGEIKDMGFLSALTLAKNRI